MIFEVTRYAYKVLFLVNVGSVLFTSLTLSSINKKLESSDQIIYQIRGNGCKLKVEGPRKFFKIVL